MKNIDYCVFSGSGLLFPYFVGVLDKLLTHCNIKHYIGSSGGIIAPSLLCAGYSINEIKKMCTEDLIEIVNSLNKDNNIFDGKHGLFNGTDIPKIFKDKFNKKNIFKIKDIKNITFTASNLTDFKLDTSDDMLDYNIEDVIRSTISIPFVFDYNIINNKVYVDSGIFNNFPIDLTPDNNNVVGISLNYKIPFKPNDNMFNYINSILSALVNKNTAIENNKNRNIFYINISNQHNALQGITSKITKQIIRDMINEGYKEGERIWKTIK